MKSVSVSDLAKYIIGKCVKDGRPISNLQLQKILYYIQVAFLKKYKAPLFSGEMEAWQFGPVAPEIYSQYCGFGSLRIRIDNNVCLEIDSEDKDMLDDIIEEKSQKQPWELVEETHAEGKAWKRIYKDGQGNRKIIPAELMLSYG